MIFGKTYGEGKKRPDHWRNWNDWFSWRPVELTDGSWAWLETVECRTAHSSSELWNIYRKKEKENNGF